MWSRPKGYRRRNAVTSAGLTLIRIHFALEGVHPYPAAAHHEVHFPPRLVAPVEDVFVQVAEPKGVQHQMLPQQPRGRPP